MNIVGNNGNNNFVSTNNTDNVFGLGGNDILFGNAGNDTLFGDAGNDYISGQSGRDRATGGLGADKFSLQTNGSLDYLGAGGMEIMDFDSAEGDKILVADLGADNANYSLGLVNWTGGAPPDTAIYYDGDVIAVATDNPFVNIGDFSFVS